MSNRVSPVCRACQRPWAVKKVNLDTSLKRIDFEPTCTAKRLPFPHCAAPEQGVHDRMNCQWRQPDFFDYEAGLHAQIPRWKLKRKIEAFGVREKISWCGSYLIEPLPYDAVA